MTERLQKILSARGMASRRKAEELIRAGQVSVNGVTATLGLRRPGNRRYPGGGTAAGRPGKERVHLIE